MYIYLYNEEIEKYEVGFYDPTDNFIIESEQDTQDQARKMVNFLNGGQYPSGAWMI